MAKKEKNIEKNKGIKALILSGLIYIIVGLIILIFMHRISDIIDINEDYIFIGAMILILLGIKDIAIMPIFMDIEKENKNKKDN